jgi:hypothetical protein
LRNQQSFPDVTVVVLDLVRFEKRHEFLLKRVPPVVCFLTRNVTTDYFLLGLTNCECSIALLPSKPPQLGVAIMNPTRGVRFDSTQNLRNRFVLTQANQKVDVVSNTVGEQTKAALTANRTTQVFAQPGPQFSVTPGLSIFGGKHQVIKKAGIGMCHEVCLARVSATPAGFGAVTVIVPQGCASALERLRLTLG